MATRPAAEQAPLRDLRSYARERGIQEGLAVRIYEEEFERLSRKARVRKFLPLLAEKHAKETLGDRRF
jgi:hypothetical protein